MLFSGYMTARASSHCCTNVFFDSGSEDIRSGTLFTEFLCTGLLSVILKLKTAIEIWSLDSLACNVQFSSRWYLGAQKKPICAQRVSQKFPQRCL